MQTETLPTWASEHQINFIHAPATLKKYVKQICKMSPQFYAVKTLRSGEKEYAVWNTRRIEVNITESEISEYWSQ